MVTVKVVLNKLSKYWVIIALIIIIYFGFQIRVSGFFSPDGSYRWQYLRNIDSYNFLREMELTVQNGGAYFSCSDNAQIVHPELECEKSYISPLTNPYPYIGAWSYMLIGSNFGLRLWEWLIYFPALLAALIAIPMYILGKSLYDKKAGLLAALFIMIVPDFMSRTLGADPDSDGIVMLLAMLTIASYFYMHSKLKDKIDKRTMAHAIIAGFFLASFAFVWAHWYIFLIIFGFVVLKTIANLGYYKKSKDRKQLTIVKVLWVSFLIYFTTYGLITIPFKGPDAVTGLFLSPISQIGFNTDQGGIKGEIGLFPNVYVSVAELQRGGDWIAAVNRAGIVFFVLSVLSLIYCVISLVFRKRHLPLTIVLVLWMLGTIFVSTIAVRFSTLLVPAICLGASVIFAKLFRIVLKEDSHVLD